MNWDWVVSFFLLLGGFFMFTASLGILRFPDLFTRMQATTKASSLALGCLLVATMFFFRTTDITLRASIIILFIFITAPIGAHLIAKAAHLLKVPMWEGTVLDELRKDQEEQAAPKKPAKPQTPKTLSKDPKQKISEIFKNLKGKKF